MWSIVSSRCWQWMSQLNRNPWLAFAIVGGLAYPPLVYFGLSRLPPGSIVLFGVGLIGLRLLGTWRAERQAAATLVLAGVGLTTLQLLAPSLAPRAYPIVISLATATIFGRSLIEPPTVIERIARIYEPHLPPQGVAYTRQVTMVWTIFLIANAAISGAFAIWGSLETWTLWNGLISYLLMGTLFVGEMAVRPIVRRRHTALS
jgi:uncharacterized membrane protein